jgi:hypothetical protein
VRQLLVPHVQCAVGDHCPSSDTLLSEAPSPKNWWGLRPDDTEGFECHSATTAKVAVEEMFRTDETDAWQSDRFRAHGEKVRPRWGMSSAFRNARPIPFIHAAGYAYTARMWTLCFVQGPFILCRPLNVPNPLIFRFAPTLCAQVEALPQYDCRLSPTIQPPTVVFASKIKPTSSVRRKPSLEAAAHPQPRHVEPQLAATPGMPLPQLHTNGTVAAKAMGEYLEGVIHIALGIPTTTSGTQLVRSPAP